MVEAAVAADMAVVVTDVAAIVVGFIHTLAIMSQN